MAHDVEIHLSEYGPTARITIVPPLAFSKYNTPLVLIALIRTNLTRSVIDRQILETAEVKWGFGVGAFEDVGHSTEEQDEHDLRDIQQIGVPIDFTNNPVRQCSVRYSFDTGQQAVGTSAKKRLRSILALKLDQIEPISFIIGQDILDRERRDSSEEEKIRRLLGG